MRKSWTKGLAAAVVAISVLTAAGGCAKDQKKLSQREEAKQRWNGARAAVLLNLAKQQFEAGAHEQCRKSLTQALALDQKNVRIWILAAKLDIEESKLEAALQDLEMAKAADGKNAEAYYLLGVVNQRWQKLETALEMYKTAAEKLPAEPAYVLAQAETLVLLDQLPEATTLLQSQLSAFDNNATLRDALGQLFVQQGEFAEGASMLRQASLLAPDDQTIREHLALALFYDKDFSGAATALDRLVKDEKYATRVDLITAYAESLLQNGHPREARDQFERAAELDGNSVTAALNLAKVSLQLNDPKRADVSVRKALALDAKNSEAQLTLGYLRLRQEKLDEALSAFRKANILDPNDIVSLCMAGVVLEKQGRGAEAMSCYMRALKLKPNDELAATLMAQIQTNE
jgi:Flp pilus assembly protein TadD